MPLPWTRLRRRTAVLIGAIAAVVVAALVVGFAVATAGGPAEQRLTYSASDAAIANPERGWYAPIDSVLTDREFNSVPEGTTLLFSYVRLDDYRSGPLPQNVLDELAAGLSAVRDAGLKIILRFAYNNGPYPDSQPDAPESVIDAQLAQLKPVLAANSDVVALFQAGFIGAWGEWHTSTNSLDTDAAAKARIAKSILAAFPADRDVDFRYPSDLTALVGTPPADVAGDDDSDVARMGNHQDCFLASDPDDQGTWNRSGDTTPAAEKAFIGKIGRYAAVGGETCNSSPPPRTNCTTALQEMAEMHFSYLNRVYEPNTLAKLQSEGCLDEIGVRLGYRFQLTSATLPAAVDPGDTVVGTASIRNVGFAAPFNDRPVEVIASDGTHSYRAAVSADPGGWQPGTTTRVRFSIRIPSSAPAGVYRIGLALPDAAEDLATRPAYSIRFANAGTWDSATGVNELGSVPIGAVRSPS